MHHYLELVEWCAERYSSKTLSILTYETNQIFLTTTKEDIIKTLRLQFAFVQSLQRPDYVIPTLTFPIKYDTCHTIVQNILSMYTQVFGQIHDHTLSKAFVGFLMFLEERVKFDYPKLILDKMHEQLSNFSTLSAFTYQAYLIYMILERYSLTFQSMMEM